MNFTQLFEFSYTYVQSSGKVAGSLRKTFRLYGKVLTRFI